MSLDQSHPNVWNKSNYTSKQGHDDDAEEDAEGWDSDVVVDVCDPITFQGLAFTR